MDFRSEDVADLARRVRAREVSARELTDGALDRIDGRAIRTPVRAELTAAVRHRPGREAYRDARLFCEDNRLLVEPLATRGSHDILCQARRNALVIIPSEDGARRE